MSNLRIRLTAFLLVFSLITACQSNPDTTASQMVASSPTPGLSPDLTPGPPQPTPTEDTPTSAEEKTEPTQASSLAQPVEVVEIVEYPVPSGSRPHDVAPAPDGSVWYTAQGSGELGKLDPASGETRHIPLGAGSRPHGVIVGPDGAPWITDGGLNAIVRVDPMTEEVQVCLLYTSDAADE